VKGPTEAELDRAATTLAAIARIPSLVDGVVVFDADGLAGGWWYDVDERPGMLSQVWAPVPTAAAGEDLDVVAHRAVEAAIAARQSELEAMAFELLDGGRETTAIVSKMYEAA